jgi:tellurite resistance protein TerC
MDKPLWMWCGFFGIVALLLALDLGLLHRSQREISVRESLWVSLGYVLVSLGFGALVFRYIGHHAGRDFYTGYVIEKSLSMDNIFVMSLVLAHFRVPHSSQHRVLFWGIAGVLLLRGIMIGLGAVLIAKFHPILYFFGAFLLFTGAKMLLVKEEEKGLSGNRVFAWLKRHMAVTDRMEGNRFFVQDPSVKTGQVIRKATPLFLALVLIELSDVVFATDSVPAVFAVTTDPFVVYTSNIFAILGLRALYFALAAMLHRFRYLKYALALVLMFIGAKIFLSPVIVHIPSGVSLAVTVLLLGAGVLLSLYKTRKAS